MYGLGATLFKCWIMRFSEFLVVRLKEFCSTLENSLCFDEVYEFHITFNLRLIISAYKV
jgi:hypothetical protein